MHRLSSHFVLGYHGCKSSVGERILAGNDFKSSNNVYDWLGKGIYFWENDPKRALQFCQEKQKRDSKSTQRKWASGDKPFVVGAVIDLGLCLDFTTTVPTDLSDAYKVYKDIVDKAGVALPKNSDNGLLKPLDCAIINFLHDIRAEQNLDSIDSLKGAYLEGQPIFEGSSLYDKTHIQICVRNKACIKGVFRLP